MIDIKFVKGMWTGIDGNELPADLELVPIDLQHAVAKFDDRGQLVEQRVITPGEKFPRLVGLDTASLNGEPHRPWLKQYTAHLLNLETMDRYIYPTVSTGGFEAISELLRATDRKCRQNEPGSYTRVVLRDLPLGPGLYPRVWLRDVEARRHLSYGAIRFPHFEIKGWVFLDDGGGKSKKRLRPMGPITSVKPTPELVAV